MLRARTFYSCYEPTTLTGTEEELLDDTDSKDGGVALSGSWVTCIYKGVEDLVGYRAFYRHKATPWPGEEPGTGSLRLI
jgi:hypothetical protein